MNMITVLLGTTGMLLVVVVAISIGNMSAGAKPDKIAALEQELLAIDAAEMELRQSRAQQAYVPSTLPPARPIVPTVPVPVDLISDNAFEKEALKQEIIERDMKIAEMEIENAKIEQQADIAEAEVEFALEKGIERHDKEKARARFIRDAMLMARVTEWSAENGFAVIEIIRPDLVSLNDTLAIRRNSGIVGHLQISAIYEANKAVADPVEGTFFGGLDVHPGDELIVPD